MKKEGKETDGKQDGEVQVKLIYKALTKQVRPKVLSRETKDTGPDKDETRAHQDKERTC